MPLFLFRLPWLIAVMLLWPHTALADRPLPGLLGTSAASRQMVSHPPHSLPTYSPSV